MFKIYYDSELNLWVVKCYIEGTKVSENRYLVDKPPYLCLCGDMFKRGMLAITEKSYFNDYVPELIAQVEDLLAKGEITADKFKDLVDLIVTKAATYINNKYDMGKHTGSSDGTGLVRLSNELLNPKK